jgi:hypothetical protein
MRYGTFGMEVGFSPLITDDKAVLRRIIDEETWFGGNTPLWATLDSGLKLLATESQRRVLIVLSDGKSKADYVSNRDVVKHMHQTDVMVYAVGFDEAGLSKDLKALAEESGGGHASLRLHSDTAPELAAIVSELHHQYLLGFTTDVLDGATHVLEVRTTAPGATVRARRSYVAG